jgi:L-ascorbate metabolism protein UlaG (beta-lactamase superfamily)
MKSAMRNTKLQLFLVVCGLVCGAQAADKPVDALRLSYFGHSSFEWITPRGYRIVIDPYGNWPELRWFDCSFPAIEADLVLVSHPHLDHSGGVPRITGHPKIVTQAGPPLISPTADYAIRAIAGLHARPDKPTFGRENVIFLLEIGGIRFVHWGDNGPDISAIMLSQIGRVDVLMLPVDESEHLLTLQEDAQVISKLKPRVVVPMHYFDPGLTSSCSMLRPIDRWLGTQHRVRRLPRDGITLTPDQLPDEPEVWVFERAPRCDSLCKRINEALPCTMHLDCSPGLN